MPNEARTPAERRKNAQKAGIASGVARREKSAASDVARMILSGNIPVESAKTLVKKMGLPETELNVQAAIIAGQAFAAMKGNHKSAEFVLALVGETPSAQGSVNADKDRQELRDIFEDVKNHTEPETEEVPE